MEMEGFEVLESLKSSSPRASISKRGKVSINEAAVIKYQLGKFDYAKLLYNEKKNVLGVVFLKESPSENGLVLHKRAKSGLWIAGKASLASKAILPDETNLYSFKPYKKESKREFVIDLNTAKERKSKK